MSFKKFVFKNIGFFLVFAVSALYILKGLFEISKTGAGVAEILGNSLLAMAAGFAINVIFRQNGIIYAEDDEEVISVNNLHKRTVDEITPKIDLLDEFCKAENERALKELRTRVLSAGGLKYENCFDENGVAKCFALLEEEKKKVPPPMLKKEMRSKYKAYKKAVKLKITHLTPSALTTDGAKDNDPFDFGITKGKYQMNKSGFDILTRPIFGLLFGYYTLKKIEGFSAEDILWNALQIVIFLVFGVIQMFESYMFIKNDNTSRILKKIDKLQKFKIYSEKKEKTEQCIT